MKRVLYISIPILLSMGSIFSFRSSFPDFMDIQNPTLDLYTDNIENKNLISGSDNNCLQINTPELRIVNLQRLLQAESVPIMNIIDPGSNPPNDYFGILGNLTYPLQELEITDTDEIVIIIRPSANQKSDELDAYIAYNTKAVMQAKDEMCYFFTSIGTTPNFYVSIYKNGFAVKKDVGIFGAHFSKISDEFKPVKITASDNSNAIACISSFDEQTKSISNEYLYLATQE